MWRTLVPFFVIALSASCGYRQGTDSTFSPQATFYVPFIEEDPYGDLTASVIQEINRSDTFFYSKCADYNLCVRITRVKENHIGFRYEVDESGDTLAATNLLNPCEERLSIDAEVSVYSNATGELVCGPLKFIECLDFDHDYYASHRKTNVLSLGQFTEVEEAHDIALRPLYRRLARRIVEDLSVM